MLGYISSCKESLARKLAIWIGLFFLVASIFLAGWTIWLDRANSLAELENLAKTNASFVGKLRLPLSPELASKLSSILDLGVVFYNDNSLAGEWPKELLPAIREMAERETPAARRTAKHEIAVSSLPEGGRLVLFRNSTGPYAILSPPFLLPTLILTLGCACLAFVLGRSMVGPLQTLTRWLPNLSADSPTPQDSIPDSILSRPDEVGTLSRALLDTRNNLWKEKELRAQSERLAALGRVATSLAHEVKNPAAGIRMLADLLQENANAEDKHSLGLIRDEIDRITELANQWLYVARSYPPRVEIHDLIPVLDRVKTQLRPLLDHAEIELTIDTSPDETVFVRMDRERIAQVVRNLIRNSIEAMPEGGTIALRLRKTGGKAELHVNDEGHGFSPAALKHFGEPFFSEREGGMGIGLTLSREVVEAHGGHIHPENRSEGGASVAVQIPLATETTAS